MNLLVAKNWSDYSLLDSGEGERLERFGEYILSRPDPQAIWKKSLVLSEWQKADATFVRESGDKGRWQKKGSMPSQWTIKYKNLIIICKLTPFKHTGVFPEQAVWWEEIKQRVKETKRQSNILNLFGYTGVASLVAAEAGAKVTHVDSSYPTIGWAKENQKESKLEDKPIRWILDDALKFCQRELKRGVKYDGIIMDPPIYGHGPKGEKWDFEKNFPELLEICTKLLSDTPLFVIVNAYAISASSIMLENVLKDFLKDGEIESGEIVLEEQNNAKRLLSTGIFVRWSKKN